MESPKYYIAKLILKLQIPAIRGSRLDPTCHIAAQCHIVDTEIGRYTDVGYNCQLLGATIGSFCSFGANIRLGGAAHPLHWVSTSQVFDGMKNSLGKKFSYHSFDHFKHTNVGHDVWIADNALIKGGVSIGTGAVIGMGSVVTKDVPPYSIVAGNPAKIIKYRFDNGTIDRLLATKWWELSDEELLEHSCYVNNVEDFLSSLGG